MCTMHINIYIRPTTPDVGSLALAFYPASSYLKKKASTGEVNISVWGLAFAFSSKKNGNFEHDFMKLSLCPPYSNDPDLDSSGVG